MRADEDRLDSLHKAIDEFADAEAAAVVNEARVEARLRVRSVLADAMTERLLETAQTSLGAWTSAGKGSPGDPSGGSGTAVLRTQASRSPAAAGADAPSRAPEHPSQAAAKRSSPKHTPSDVPDTRAAELGWYVYGIARQESEVEPMVGIDGSNPLTTIRDNGLAAISSQVPLAEFGEEALSAHLEDLTWLEENARTHEYILDRVREQTTLVPMRLCTIYRSEKSVRGMLSREHDFLVDALTRLAGRTEWGVKIFAGPVHQQRGGQQGAAGSDLAERLAEAGPGESYMLSKRLEGIRDEERSRETAERCEAAHTRLSAAAVEARLNPLQPSELTGRHETMLLNGVYLVEDVAVDDFSATVDLVREEQRAHGLELELTGPWPPYNFVNSSVEIGQ